MAKGEKVYLQIRVGKETMETATQWGRKLQERLDPGQLFNIDLLFY